MSVRPDRGTVRHTNSAGKCAVPRGATVAVVGRMKVIHTVASTALAALALACGGSTTDPLLDGGSDGQAQDGQPQDVGPDTNGPWPCGTHDVRQRRPLRPPMLRRRSADVHSVRGWRDVSRRLHAVEPVHRARHRDERLHAAALHAATAVLRASVFHPILLAVQPEPASRLLRDVRMNQSIALIA